MNKQELQTLETVLFDGNNLDGRDNFMGELGESAHWIVAAVLPRDADLVTQANWEVMEEYFQVNFLPFVNRVTIGHWAAGHIEFLLIDPKNDKALEKLKEFFKSLQEYPLLDDETFSRIEYEYKREIFYACSLSERIAKCKELNVPIFAARYFENLNHELYDYIE